MPLTPSSRGSEAGSKWRLSGVLLLFLEPWGWWLRAREEPGRLDTILARWEGRRGEVRGRVGGDWSSVPRVSWLGGRVGGMIGIGSEDVGSEEEASY